LFGDNIFGKVLPAYYAGEIGFISLVVVLFLFSIARVKIFFPIEWHPSYYFYY
jgi:hypothetical protein